MQTFSEWFTERADQWVGASPDRNFARLAEAIGCDPAMITNWRNGPATPSPRSKLGAVARLLALDPPDAARCYRLAGVDIEPVLGTAQGA